MAFPIIGVLAAVVPIIERLWPDPQKAAEAKLRLFEMQQSGELASLDAEVRTALAQLEINKEEAKAGPFRGGWRPFIGWTCGTAFAWNFVLLPVGNWALAVAGIMVVPPPTLGLEVMMPVLLGMLGLGGMRSLERLKDKA